MNKTWIGLAVVAALVAATIGWSGQAPAQMKTEKIEGTVTSIDARNGMVTLRGDDGQTHSFKGDAATLNDLKVGDKVTLNKRAEAAPSR